MAVGLGTGSTARFVLEELARLRRAGQLAHIVGVPTSRQTEALAAELSIPLTTLDTRPSLDIAIDGADEVGPGLDLIKGLGGALLWEKIVAAAAARLIIAIDSSKLVERLGTRAPLPVEVVVFGARTHEAAVERLGGRATLRRGPDGQAFVTDSGNHILDCNFAGGLGDPMAVHDTLKSRAGVVETGLFLGMTDTVVVGREDGAEVLERVTHGVGA